MTQARAGKLPRSAEANSKDEQKKKKKEALVWLKEFGERLDAVCEKRESFDKWLRRAEELSNFLDAHTDAVRPDWQAEIAKIVRDTKPVDASAGKACEVLQGRVTQYIWHLDREIKYSWVAQIVKAIPTPVIYALGAGVVAVALAAAGYGYLRSASPQIAVTNVHCAPISFAGQPAFLSGLDVSLPAAPIAPGQTGTVTLPPVSLTVDATQPSTMTLTVLGYSAPVPIDTSLIDLAFDGQSYGRGPVIVNLALNTNYTLKVTCRS
jgi:hypothetical protein